MLKCWFVVDFLNFHQQLNLSTTVKLQYLSFLLRDGIHGVRVWRIATIRTVAITITVKAKVKANTTTLASMELHHCISRAQLASQQGNFICFSPRLACHVMSMSCSRFFFAFFLVKKTRSKATTNNVVTSFKNELDEFQKYLFAHDDCIFWNEGIE